MRAALAEGYGLAALRADLGAGLVVGLVALPLSMALAIAVGVPPQHGLYTAIVAGFVTGACGGSRVQVTGPTAAFVVILAPIVAKLGVGGLLCATMLAGCLLMLLGLARLGRLIAFVPYPVTAGFTAGIAVVIATLQLRDFLGLSVAELPERFPEKVLALARALPSVQLDELAVGVLTLGVLLAWPRVTRRLPAPLVALALAATAAHAAHALWPEFEVATIDSRFHYVADGVVHAGIPRGLPSFVLPWNAVGQGGTAVGFDYALLEELAPPAFAIAALGAIESLLSAVIADGMTRTQHDPDAELFAQGLGNLVAPFFGGIAATGALARTAANARAGARSPLAACVHAVFLLGAMLALAPLLGALPMAALAALLLVVAWNMSEARHVVHTLRTAPRHDAFVLVTCFALTVAFDMVVAVTLGVMLAALLFMKRMADASGVALIADPHHELRRELPPGVVVYEIQGPLFFGAAQRAMASLQIVEAGVRVVVLDMRSVPVIDASGLVNLASALARLSGSGISVVLAGVRSGVQKSLERARITQVPERLTIAASFSAGLDAAEALTRSQ